MRSKDFVILLVTLGYRGLPCLLEIRLWSGTLEWEPVGLLLILRETHTEFYEYLHYIESLQHPFPTSRIPKLS